MDTNRIFTLPLGPLSVNTYLVRDPDSGDGILIDPGAEPERILDAVEREGMKPRAIVLTHGHVDHVGAVGRVKAALDIPLYLHHGDEALYRSAPLHGAAFGLDVGDLPDPDGDLAVMETLTAGSLAFRILHTPGHTPGHVTLVLEGNAFVGDCLFAGSIGRTDLPGGDYDTLLASLKDGILALGDGVKVYPGHGPATTVERERTTNPFLV